ncbi:hypothetical protein CW304_21930 [Bacillus sp. UFRGS-B20]|nr:hypothetical protein CW304_21930 [Bacillus sp. UFRGS-B20]
MFTGDAFIFCAFEVKCSAPHCLNYIIFLFLSTFAFSHKEVSESPISAAHRFIECVEKNNIVDHFLVTSLLFFKMYLTNYGSSPLLVHLILKV